MAGEQKEGSGERLQSDDPSPSRSPFIWAPLRGCLPCQEPPTLWEMDVVLSAQGMMILCSDALGGPGKLDCPSRSMPPRNSRGPALKLSIIWE